MRIKGRFNIFIRAIAFVLLTTFILQDIVYADPDLLLKSSTLAQRTLITGENKPENIQRVVRAHFGRLAFKNPDIMAVEDASLQLLRTFRALNLLPGETPAIHGAAVHGFVKISFSDGKELLFYNPELIPPDNSPEILALFSTDKHISSTRNFGKYLCESIIIPGPKKERKPAAKKKVSYKTKLKYLLNADRDLNEEIKKAIDVFYHPKSRVLRNIRRIYKIESVASMLSSELKSGLVSAESLRLAEKAASEALRFHWTNATQKWQIRSFHLHVTKALALESKKEILLENMSREDWRTYTLPENASERDREQYFKSNIQDIAIHLADLIENNSYLDRKVTLKPRLIELHAGIAGWKNLDSDAERWAMLKSAAAAFDAISNNITLGERTNSGLKYIADRCSMLAELLGYKEAPVVKGAKISKEGRAEQLELGLLMANSSSLGATTIGVMISLLTGAMFCTILAVGVAGANTYYVTLGSIAIMLSFVLAMRFLQKRQLGYYLKNVGDILVRVKDGEAFEKDKVHKLFKEVLGVYKLFLIRDLVPERKALISNLILTNIISPEEMERDKDTPDNRKRLSHLRSDEAKDLMVNDIFSSKDPTIFQPALEAVIELIAKYPKYYSKQLLPLLEESQKLPKFARALVDVLIKAERGDIKLYNVEDTNSFLDQGKDIITELAERLPKVRNDILSYLVTIAEKSDKEIELVHDLMDRIGFFITPTEEFPKASATEVAATIIKIRAERKKNSDPRKTINIVFTGGKTMPQFFSYLDKILGKDSWGDIHVYQLCEYKFYGPDNNRSIAYIINKHLPEALPAANRHFINGMSPDPEYIVKLEKDGGIDVVVLGIGGSGQLGFNGPADQFNDVSGKLKQVKVSSVGLYMGQLFPPGLGYTIGLSDIVKSRNIFLLAEGKKKSEIIKESLFEPANPQVPASILQSVKNLKVILDMEAMGEVTPTYQAAFKKMVRRLTKVEMRSRDLFENSPAAQHEINRNGMIVLSNAAEAKMLGYKPGELVGMHISDIIHPDNRNAAAERIKGKFSKRQDKLPEVEARYITKAGESIWVRINDTQIVDDDNNVIAIQSTLMNITRFKEIEAELEAVKEQLKEARRLKGGLTGNDTGAVSPRMIGLLLLAGATAIFGFILANSGFGAAEADYGKFLEASAGFMTLAGLAIPMVVKTGSASDPSKFAEKLAMLEVEINSLDTITLDGIVQFKARISFLEKDLDRIFADDVDAMEFYGKRLQTLRITLEGEQSDRMREDDISAEYDKVDDEYAESADEDTEEPVEFEGLEVAGNETEEEPDVSRGSDNSAIGQDVRDLETSAGELMAETQATAQEIKELRLDLLVLYDKTRRDKHPRLYDLYHGRLVVVAHKLEKLMAIAVKTSGKKFKKESLRDILARTEAFHNRLRIVRKYLRMSPEEVASQLSVATGKGRYAIDADTILKYEKFVRKEIPAGYVRRLADLARLNPAMILFGRPLPVELKTEPSIGRIAWKIRLYKDYSVEEMALNLHIMPNEYSNIERGENQTLTLPVLYALEYMAQIERGSIKQMIDEGSREVIVEKNPSVDRIAELLAEPDMTARFNKVAMEYMGYESKDRIANALGIDADNMKNRSKPSMKAVARLAELSHIDYGIIWFGKKLKTMLDDISSGRDNPGLTSMQKIGFKIKITREYMGVNSVAAMLETLKEKYGYVASKGAYRYEEGRVPWDSIGFGMLGYVRYVAKEAGIAPGEILFEKPLEEEVAATDSDTKKLKIMRLYVGMSTEDMAEELGVSNSTYYGYENGSVKVSSKIMSDAGNIVAGELEGSAVSLLAADTALSHKDEYERLDSVFDVTRNARRTVSLLVNIIMSQSAKLKDRKIVLAMDGSLGPTDKIRELMREYIIEALSSSSSGQGDLKKIMENLVIIDGDVGALPVRLNSIIEHSGGKDKTVITKENIIIITTKTNHDLGYFKDFDGESLITAVDDSGFRTDPGEDMNYYPMIELIFFSVARMIVSSRGGVEEYRESLWEWYRSIPNIENVKKEYFESMIYDDKGASLRRTIILKLVPRAVKLDENEARRMYERIKEFITKA